MAAQIAAARTRAALSGAAPATWAVGARVEALYEADGEWYAAQVTAVGPSPGTLLVAYEGYASEPPAALPLASVRLPAAPAEAAYRPVSAPRRGTVLGAAAASALEEPMPAWLEIRPEDDEKTRAKKKKLQKSHKSKQRFARMDLAQQAKADSWKAFAGGVGKKKGGKGGAKGGKAGGWGTWAGKGGVGGLSAKPRGDAWEDA